MLIILAEFYALDRRYGRSGIPSECPADGGRFPYEFDEGGEPGPIVSRLVPKVQMTAKLLYQIYLGMTILEAVILILGKMPIFDAITITGRNSRYGWFCNPE